MMMHDLSHLKEFQRPEEEKQLLTSMTLRPGEVRLSSILLLEVLYVQRPKEVKVFSISQIKRCF